jgi:putative oxidoreductase
MEVAISSPAPAFRSVIDTSPAKPFALLMLRLVIGFGFVAHGYAKLHRGPEKFGALLAFLGVPFPQFTAWFVALVELLGGLALMIGAFVLILSVPLIILHLVAMSTIHIHYGFSSVNTIGLTPDGPLFGPPGFEISLLYIGGIVVLAAFGPGALSVDGARSGRHRSSS